MFSLAMLGLLDYNSGRNTHQLGTNEPVGSKDSVRGRMMEQKPQGESSKLSLLTPWSYLRINAIFFTITGENSCGSLYS